MIAADTTGFSVVTALIILGIACVVVFVVYR